MDFNYTAQGWECPKCKRVYSPTTMMCFYCPEKTTTSTTTNLTTIPHGVPVGIVGGYGTPNLQASGTSHCLLYTPDPLSSSDNCTICDRPKSEHIIFNTSNQ